MNLNYSFKGVRPDTKLRDVRPALTEAIEGFVAQDFTKRRFRLRVWLRNVWVVLVVNYCVHVAPLLRMFQ